MNDLISMAALQRAVKAAREQAQAAIVYPNGKRSQPWFQSKVTINLLDDGSIQIGQYTWWDDEASFDTTWPPCDGLTPQEFIERFDPEKSTVPSNYGKVW